MPTKRTNDPATGTTRSIPLSAAECRRWLRNHSEGQLAYWSGRGHRSVAVCFTVTPRGRILLRVPDYNEIAQYATDAPVTLQVEGTAGPGTIGSVAVHGTAEVVDADSPEIQQVSFPEQWPDQLRTSVITVPLEDVRGFVRLLD